MCDGPVGPPAMAKYCTYCEQRTKHRTDGTYTYCAVCGSNNTASPLDV